MRRLCAALVRDLIRYIIIILYYYYRAQRDPNTLLLCVSLTTTNKKKLSRGQRWYNIISRVRSFELRIHCTHIMFFDGYDDLSLNYCY